MKDFASALKEYGPGSSAVFRSEEAALDYCRRLARSHYENFPVVTLLLPRRYRGPFYIIYAYCRWSDDIGDEIRDPSESLRLFAWWEAELRRAYESAHSGPDSAVTPFETVNPVILAMNRLFRDCPTLPLAPFLDLLTAFRRDQLPTHYETLEDVLDYCRYSANPVGRILLYLMMTPTEEELAWSDAICSGLQLANLWQDIKRDREMGRDYLPREIRERFSTEREAVRFLVDDAAARLESGRPLIRRVPSSFKIDLTLFIEGGLAILRKIRQIDYKVDKIRPKLTKFQMSLLFLKALFKR